jgi:DNA-binding GntR family transcriptional regulator
MQIAADLRTQIEDGRYAPGDRLPSNAVLRAAYSSATETVRRALAVLRDEGLVETHSTRGTFVLKPPGEAEPDPQITRLEAEIRAAEARLAGEIAGLREELEYTQAQVMALERQQGIPGSSDQDVGS